MTDRQRMEDLLINTKSACDLYLHGTLESSDERIHAIFDSALKNSLDMQKTIYQKMSEQGWYPAAQADSRQIRQVAQKFQAE